FRRESPPLVLILVGTVCVAQVVIVLMAWRDTGYCDWYNFWNAARGWISGDWSLYDVQTRRPSDQFVYTTLTLPHGHLLFLPLAILPRDVAAATWALVSLAAVALSVSIVVREREKELTLGELVWL